MRLTGQIILIVLATVALAETGARLLLPPPGLQPFPASQPADLLIKDETRSYAYRPGFSGDIREESETIQVTINELGMRDDAVSIGEHIDVLAVGDSFTVGYMLPADKAWPERLEYYLRKKSADSHPVRVLNGGVSGYSMAQIRLTAEKHGDLRPAMVIAGVLPFVADRLTNPYQWFEGYAVRAEKIPYLRKIDEGFLTAVPDSALSIEQQFWLMRNFRIGASVWLALRGLFTPASAVARKNGPDLLARLKSEIDQLNAFTKSKGQRLVVFLIAFQQPDGSFSDAIKLQNKTIMDFCVSRGIPAYDPLPLLEVQSKQPVFRISVPDYHWTPLANDIAAAGLAEYLISLDASN